MTAPAWILVLAGVALIVLAVTVGEALVGTILMMGLVFLGGLLLVAGAVLLVTQRHARTQ